MNLRHKTSLLLGVVVSLALTISGFCMHFLYEKALRASVYSSVDMVAQSTAATIANYLDSGFREARAIAVTLPLDALKNNHPAALERQLRMMAESFPNFRNGLFILNAQGDLLVDWPPHPEKRGRNFAFRPYFKRTREARHGVIGEPYRSARTGQPVLTFTAYLQDRQGNFLGVLGCSAQLLDPAGLGALRQKRLGQSGYIYVFDISRKIILHPDEKRILVSDVPLGANPMFDRAIAGVDAVGETVNSRGIPMLLALRKVAGSTWIVGAQEPRDEALSHINRIELRIALAGLACALLAAIIGWIAVGRLMRPLRDLENIVEHLQLPAEDDTDDTDKGRNPGRLLPLQKNPDIGGLARVIYALYMELSEALVDSRKANNELQSAQSDLTQALDASWQLTEQLESNHRILSEQAAALEEANRQLKDTQSQMLQQEKMASIGQLAAGVAHEINNPMGFVTSNLNTLGKYLAKLRTADKEQTALLADLMDAEQAEAYLRQRRKSKVDMVFEDIPELLDESLDGAKRVRDIVQNLKTFSRVDQAEESEVNINDCLDSTLKIVWNEIKYKAEVKKEFGELPLLKCHPQQLNQVFMNILVNAAHAIEERGEIRIRTWCEQQQVKVAISDNGCGIPDEVRERIFEPFFTTKEVGKGTGLGMSIAYEIIQKHGGRIEIDSRVGEGTTFTIILPLDETAVDDSATDDQPADHGQGEVRTWEKLLEESRTQETG